jgi:heat shock protein HtpX
MPAALGLSTYRWNNNLKSLGLLAAFPALLLLLVFVILYGYGWLSAGAGGEVDPSMFPSAGPGSHPRSFRPIDFALAGLAALWLPVAVIAGGWLTIGYLFNERMIRAATGAAPLDRARAPELYNLLENLCISRGMPLPKLHLIDSDAMNAYASGIDRRSYAITVTRGLLERLTKDEVEAVLGHELTHILNRDTRLLIVTVVFVGMISFIAHMVWRGLRIRSRQSAPLVVVAAIVLAVGYALAMMLRFALSRTREYLADAGSVALTKNPEAMISALRKIAGHAELPEVSSEVKQMFIENPPSAFDLGGWFATHPPVALRIRVLEQLGGLPPHHTSVIPEAGGSPRE